MRRLNIEISYHVYGMVQAIRSGLDAAGFPRHELAVRNREAPLAVRVIEQAAHLTALTRGALS